MKHLEKIAIFCLALAGASTLSAWGESGMGYGYNPGYYSGSDYNSNYYNPGYQDYNSNYNQGYGYSDYNTPSSSWNNPNYSNYDYNRGVDYRNNDSSMRDNRASDQNKSGWGWFSSNKDKTPSWANDNNLNDQVRNALRNDPIGRNIQVSVVKGEVTLYGYVPSDQDSKRVEKLVKNMSGVSDVSNELEVKSYR